MTKHESVQIEWPIWIAFSTIWRQNKHSATTSAQRLIENSVYVIVSRTQNVYFSPSEFIRFALVRLAHDSYCCCVCLWDLLCWERTLCAIHTFAISKRPENVVKYEFGGKENGSWGMSKNQIEIVGQRRWHYCSETDDRTFPAVDDGNGDVMLSSSHDVLISAAVATTTTMATATTQSVAETISNIVYCKPIFIRSANSGHWRGADVMMTKLCVCVRRTEGCT